MNTQNSQSDFFKYYLISAKSAYHQPLHEVARAAEEAGVHYFQLREKELGKRELLEIARHIRPNLIRTKFIVNGHLDVAIASGADGIHLQKGNLTVREVRQKYGKLLIGYSAHSKDEITEAAAQGADYVFASPVFKPLSKTESAEPLGVKQLSEWVKDVKVPVFALGGISENNVKMVADAGCRGAAGISFFIKDGHFNTDRMVI